MGNHSHRLPATPQNQQKTNAPTQNSPTMLIELRRSYLPHCTLGELRLPGQRTLFTIEKPWRDNQPNISCIPEGTYVVERYSGTKFKNVFQLKNVPGRSAILIHIANWAKEVQGCIGVGMKLSTAEYMVLNSGDAMDVLRESLPEKFLIRITTKLPYF